MKRKLTFLLSLFAFVWIAMTGKAGEEIERRAARQSGQQAVTVQVPGAVELWGPSNGFARIRMPHKAPMRRAADASEAPTLYGIARIDGQPTAVSFSAAPDISFTTLATDERLDASGGAVWVDGSLHVFSLNVMAGQVNGANKYEWDTSSWTVTKTLDDLWSSATATDLTYDPIDGRVYGQFHNEDMTDLYWGYVNLTTGSSTHIGRLGVQLVAVAATPEGEIYGIDHRGVLVKIDKENATFTEIGNTTILPRYLQSAVIDPATGKFYWAAMLKDDESTGLYEVDLTTGEATLISSFPGNAEVNGLYIVPAAADDAAPGYCENLKATFYDGSLSGRVSFDLPENTFGGDRITSMVYGVIQASCGDWNDDYQDFDAAGCNISKRYTMPNAGMYTFTVWAETSDGAGPKSKLSLWIGPDAPEAVNDLKLTSLDGKPHLSWTAPTKGAHDGFFAPSDVTYRVTRVKDNTVVGEGLTATEFTDESLPEGSLSGQTYEVVAIHAGQESEAVLSNSFAFGAALEVPADIDFGRAEDQALCTIEDTNADGTTWVWHWAGYAQYFSNMGQADDWMFTPPVKLEKGKPYDVTYCMYLTNGLIYRETYEIKAGHSASSADMAYTVMEPTEAEVRRMNEYYYPSGQFIPEESGEYVFGFHILTNGGYRSDLCTFSISEGAALTSPEPVSRLSAIAAEQGQLSVTLKFDAPTKDLKGNALSGTLNIDIYRAGEKIGTVENVQPGSTQTYVDDNAAQGDNEYSVTAVLPTGEQSSAMTIKAYAGVDTPASPSNVKLRLEGGDAILSWDAPAVGANGGYIDPSQLTYSIYSSLHEDIIAEGIVGNTVKADVSALLNEEQCTLFLGVYALNAAGGSEGVPSNSIVLGAPYSLPFEEGFPYGTMSHMIIQEDGNGYAGWDILSQSGAPAELPGCIAFSSYREGDQRLVTGKISLKDAKNPTLTFLCCGDGYTEGHLDVEIATDYTGEFKVCRTVTFAETDKEWQKVTIPLDEYKGAEYIHVGLHGYGTGKEGFGFSLDDLTVDDLYEHNLAVSALSAEASRVEIGQEPAALTLKVTNKGSQAVKAADWNVVFWQDGAEKEMVSGVDIEPFATGEVRYSFVPTFDDPERTLLSAEIVFEADEYTADNKSADFKLKIDRPQWPAVTDLAGSYDETTGNASLQWSKPDMGGIPEGSFSESFEDYASFDIEKAGDWTMHNIDGSFTYTITGFGWENTYLDQAWIVWDPANVTNYLSPEPLSEAWWPHSGDKCMACFAEDDGQNDDWLVSPQLTGKEQEISFFARSTVDEYGLEKFEVLYSTTGTGTDDFTKLDEANVPADWTEFKYTLPAGARYFAIRCISKDRFCLLVDDVEFERTAKPLDVTFKGFNVYRAGEKLNAEPLTEAKWSGAHAGTKDYFVKVVYDRGESARSNSVNITSTGIEDVETDGTDAPLYDVNGLPVAEPRKGEIYIRKGEKLRWNK